MIFIKYNTLSIKNQVLKWWYPQDGFDLDFRMCILETLLD